MSRKGEQANYLLNFHYEEYPSNSVHRKVGGNGKRKSNVSSNQTVSLVCRHRFVINEVESNVLAFKDPDRILNWDSVVQIIALLEVEENICPICLSFPVAARITKCGHIFCLPCLSHYFQGAEVANCPMCSKQVYLKQLKHVTAIPVHRRSAGDVVHFTLVHREKGNTNIFSKSQQLSLLPTYGSPSAIFSRVCVCSPEDLKTILRRDTEDLLDKLRSMEGSQGEEADIERSSLVSALSLVESHPAYSGNLHCSAETSVALKGAPLINPTEFVFYMATDGQPYFLCSLNMQMIIYDLLPSFNGNSFSNLDEILDTSGKQLPQHLECKVLQIDTYSQTDETRKRFKHLSHIPLSSDFYIVELDLTNVVSQSTLDHFQDQLNSRVKSRDKVAAQAIREHKEAERKHQREVEARKAANIMEIPRMEDFPALEDEKPLPSLDDAEAWPETLRSERTNSNPKIPTQHVVTNCWGQPTTFVETVKSPSLKPSVPHTIVIASTNSTSKPEETDTTATQRNALLDKLLVEGETKGKGSKKKNKITISLTSLTRK